MKYSFRMIAIAIGIAGVSILTATPLQKTFVAECSVSLVNGKDEPVPGIRISEIWDAYSYDFQGGSDQVTDKYGQVHFPAQVQAHSVLYWATRAVLTKLNYGVHASSGTTADISVSEPGLPYEKGSKVSFVCSDAECSAHPLQLSFQSNSL